MEHYVLSYSPCPSPISSQELSPTSFFSKNLSQSNIFGTNIFKMFLFNYKKKALRQRIKFLTGNPRYILMLGNVFFTYKNITFPLKSNHFKDKWSRTK